MGGQGPHVLVVCRLGTDMKDLGAGGRRGRATNVILEQQELCPEGTPGSQWGSLRLTVRGSQRHGRGSCRHQI